VDIGVSLLDIDYNELTSTPFAFEACANMAYDAACRAANPVLLEPIMKVDIITPKEFVGEVMSLVSQRGGIIHGTETKNVTEVIHAEAPLATMFGFTTRPALSEPGSALPLVWNSAISNQSGPREQYNPKSFILTQ